MKILLKIDSNPLPNPHKSELLKYTNEIKEDIEPIELSLLLRDDYNNEFINRKDVDFKNLLIVMNGNEKPEQNIEIGPDNKTFIINFVTDYHKESLNLSVVFNTDNDTILIRDNIIVKINVKTFLEPEELVIPIAYKPGKLFLYKNFKILKTNFQVEDDEKEKTQKDDQTEINGDFMLYIRKINYEKGEDGKKVILYTGYLSILFLSNKNTTSNDTYIIYDQKLIDIYNKTRNISDISSPPSNETFENSSGFVKIEFYENGNIKQMYYPKQENFQMKSMLYITEFAELIIPKISSKLFSEDIYGQLNDILKDEENTDEIDPTNKRTRLLRRLRERTPKKKKEITKIKKFKTRILSENSTEILEREILPSERDIDVQLRQLDKNGDNSSNITFLSYQDVYSEKAKLTGSLDNKEVFTNINDEGMVDSIYESQNLQLESGHKDEFQDRFIKD